MTTSLITLRNGVASTLVACGPYSATQISTCDYGVVERTSGCAIIFNFDEGDFEPITYGDNNQPAQFANIRFNGECYIQFTGDGQAYLGKVWSAIDDIRNTFAKDVSLQGSACMAWVSRFKYNIDEGYEMGGKDWGLVRFVLSIHDL